MGFFDRLRGKVVEHQARSDEARFARQKRQMALERDRAELLKVKAARYKEEAKLARYKGQIKKSGGGQGFWSYIPNPDLNKIVGSPMGEAKPKPRVVYRSKPKRRRVRVVYRDKPKQESMFL